MYGTFAQDAENERHWLSRARHTFKPRQTRIGRSDYDCPEVTFASGITNLVGHGDDYVVVSYGVDDCYSRSIVVRKARIEMLLLAGGG